MLITLQQLKTSLSAVKSYVDKILPKKVSDLDNDTGFITNEEISGKVDIEDLASVATSGDYDDLINKPTIPVVPVTDVQINETSILSNGVANIPIASGTDFGVAKVSPTYGIGLYDGFLILNNATSQDIKSGNNSAKAISAYRQHESTFYGLTKAAGVSMASSDNPVGTYTDAAKTAIKNMLGVTDPTVSDVQINGTSILDNGIANIIGATAQSFGVIKLGQGFKTDNSTGATGIDWASADNIKVGTSQYKAINPYAQHRAVFYGLAKAAGDSTQKNSDNVIGTYTNEAKTAIQNMLNVPSKEDLNIKMPNVTFGTKTTLVDTITLSFSKDGDNDWYCTIENPISGFVKANFTWDTLYRITWDGIEYEGFLQEYERSNSDDNTVINTLWYDWRCIGNANILGYHNYYITDAPFCIAYDFHRNDAEIQIFTLNTNATHTLKIDAIPFVTTVTPVQYYGDVYHGRLPIANGTGILSVIEGYGSIASGEASHSEGMATIASGETAHAEGVISVASGEQGAHAEGFRSTASGDYGSHAEGIGAIASGENGAHAEGTFTTASGNIGAHAEGYYSVSSGTYGSHAEGRQTVSSNTASHAEGYATTASGSSSHSQGRQSTASGNTAHAEGYYAVASGTISHAQGNYTIADGRYMHAMGSYNTATAYPAWAAGTTYAVGDKVTYSANGYKCITANFDQEWTVGNWEKLFSNSDIAFIIGNGTAANNRSNVLSTDWSGNQFLAGDIYVGCDGNSANGVKLARLSDIQLNGTSIINDGVANIPFPSWPNPGVVKVSNDYGIGVNSVGTIQTMRASDAHIKDGSNVYRPIVPVNQHTSVFYGLAKAAGDTSQSQSNNVIGNYTDNAKTAIQTMLGILTVSDVNTLIADALSEYGNGDTDSFGGSSL